MDVQRQAFQEWYIANHHDGDIHPNQQLLEWSEKGGFYFASSVEDLWEAWQAAKAHEAEKLKGCVLVPVQCPDPDFADSLFDELSKKAIGEFGDDLLIYFSDIDEEEIWALMVEAAKAQAVPDTYTPIVLALEDVQSKIAKTSFLTMDEENENEVMAVDANELAAYIDELIEAQEPAND